MSQSQDEFLAANKIDVAAETGAEAKAELRAELGIMKAVSK